MTGKRANDPVYVATLAEELRNIEVQILQAEATMALGPTTPSCTADSGAPDQPADINWIRTKSSELSVRLRRIETVFCQQQDSAVSTRPVEP